MKRIFLAILLLSLSSYSSAQEAINLNTPIGSKPAINNYTPVSLTLVIMPSSTITIVLLANDGTTKSFSYPCSVPCPFTTPAQVRTLINTLNTVNLSTRSLWRRIFDRLILDFPGEFVGGATVQ